MVQGKYTLNENQSLPCWHWLHGPMFFLNRFLRFVLLLLLHHSGKLTIPHDHLFLLIYNLHLFLFKLLQTQGELRISGDICVVFWWARYGNFRLSFLRRDNLPFFRKGFVEICFWPIFDRHFQKVVFVVLQKCVKDCVVIGGRSTPFNISSCAIDLVDGAQCKCKRKNWFLFYAFLWTCRETAKYQALEIVYLAHSGALKGW